MKTIILSCGTGIATSAAVSKKISDLLDANGYAGAYEIVQCPINEAKRRSESADLLIATTAEPAGLACPYVNGVPFLTSVGRAEAEQRVLDVMGR